MSEFLKKKIDTLNIKFLNRAFIVDFLLIYG